ncbi:MAG TPA: FG-GAP-like repeat-containing protein [Planctomycetota bacterium]|nr:FG-GAP-like repeat-containing protein [Planctomycetota bacterium]
MTSRSFIPAVLARFAIGMIALLVATAASARAQCAVHVFEGQASFDFLGWSVGGGGDVDGDGYADVVVGALGYSSGGRAEVYSGKTGSLLHTFPAPGFMSCALAGDVDGDGKVDVIVGFSDFAETDKARVFSGATGAVLHTLSSNVSGDGFGFAVAGAGDVDGDGLADVIVGAPQSSSASPSPGYARVYSGATGALLHEFTGLAIGDSFGYAVDGAGDVDADGRADLIVGAWRNSLNGAEAGMVQVFSGATGQILHQVVGAVSQDYLGQSVAGAGDIDGDGHDDFVIGAPGDDSGGSQAGSASVYSGFDGQPLFTFLGTFLGNQFGSSVDGAGDVDGDQVPDLVIGNSGGQSSVRVFSGASGLLVFFAGGIQVTSVSGAGDIDGDGLAEIVVGDPIKNDPEVGQATIYAGPGAGPVAYCTAKINSQGCTPAISWSGAPSASSGDSFTIQTSLVINSKAGILIYGTSGPDGVPFQGGTLCATSPITRTPGQSSGGNSPPDDCSGNLSFDFNAWVQSGIDPLLGAGVRVNAQHWYRDPTATFGSGLGDALEFTICN